MAAVGRSVSSTAVSGSRTGSAVVRGTLARPTVLGGTPARPTVLGGTPARPTVLGGTPARPTVLCATASRSTVVGATASRSTVFGATAARSTVLGSMRSRSSFIGGFGIGSSGLGGCRGSISPHGSVGFLPHATGLHRHFSSLSFKDTWKAKWQKHKPGEDTMAMCTLLGTGVSIMYIVDAGLRYVIKEAEDTSKEYIDEKLKEMETEHKQFRNLATATHHDFVRQSNEAAAAIQDEMNVLRSRMLALEEKEFAHRKELILAAEVLQKAGLGDAVQ